MRPTRGPEDTAALLAVVPLLAAKGDNLRLDTDIGSILGFILVGMIVGLLARLIVPGRDPVGLLGTLVVGVIGAVLGGWLAGAFFEETAGVDWLASIGVAVLLVLLLRAGSRRRAWR
ncbi:MAG TPA: GlsB/YeaQ/YmgE family stress response membrane protein [Actinomycetota bacterium]|nr:GlsB/YeaQ/YmgE family stress response membrane protein [Actinomycetota bacterium]